MAPFIMVLPNQGKTARQLDIKPFLNDNTIDQLVSEFFSE